MQIMPDDFGNDEEAEEEVEVTSDDDERKLKKAKHNARIDMFPFKKCFSLKFEQEMRIMSSEHIKVLPFLLLLIPYIPVKFFLFLFRIRFYIDD